MISYLMVMTLINLFAPNGTQSKDVERAIQSHKKKLKSAKRVFKNMQSLDI